MSRLTWSVALGCAALMCAGSVATAAAAPPARSGSGPQAQVDGRTYVLLGPSVFGVTVQQDPLEYHAALFADGTVRGTWHYDYWEAGQETTFSGRITCLSVSGSRAWVGGPITESSDPTQVGMGAWWQVADNGEGRHPVTPDRTTFVGIGTMTQATDYCAGEPDPHFIFDVQLGGISIENLARAG